MQFSTTEVSSYSMSMAKTKKEYLKHIEYSKYFIDKY